MLRFVTAARGFVFRHRIGAAVQFRRGFRQSSVLLSGLSVFRQFRFFCLVLDTRRSDHRHAILENQTSDAQPTTDQLATGIGPIYLGNIFLAARRTGLLVGFPRPVKACLARPPFQYPTVFFRKTGLRGALCPKKRSSQPTDCVNGANQYHAAG